jgi:hypothetical protein
MFPGDNTHFHRLCPQGRSSEPRSVIPEEMVRKARRAEVAGTHSPQRGHPEGHLGMVAEVAEMAMEIGTVPEGLPVETPRWETDHPERPAAVHQAVGDPLGHPVADLLPGHPEAVAAEAPRLERRVLGTPFLRSVAAEVGRLATGDHRTILSPVDWVDPMTRLVRILEPANGTYRT